MNRLLGGLRRHYLSTMTAERSLLLPSRRQSAVVVAATATTTAAAALAAFCIMVGDGGGNHPYESSSSSSSSLCEENAPPPPPPPPLDTPSSSSSPPVLVDGPKLIFLGSGSSTGCPVGVCTLTLTQSLQQFSEQASSLSSSSLSSSSSNTPSLATPKCQVSHLASRGDPKYNKDYRNNPSFLIHHYDPATQSYKNIIIDVGKTFREGSLRWFPEHDIQSLDAIVLTHEHMDAAAGLDDVRGFQRFTLPPPPPPPPPPSTTTNNADGGATVEPVQPPKRIPVPVYLSRHCHDKLQSQFPFLFPKRLGDSSCGSCSCSDPPTPLTTTTTTTETSAPSSSSSSDSDSDDEPAKPIVIRDVAGFLVNIFQAYQPMHIEGLEIIPLPVWHGDDLISYGFAFSLPTTTKGDGNNDDDDDDSINDSINVVYLSDISRMVPETMQFIQQQLPPTDILIVDSLLWHRQHPTHFSLEQAVELRDQLQPRMQTYLVGMSCESYPPHDEMEVYLKSTYGDSVTMAHDGLSIPLDQQRRIGISTTTTEEETTDNGIL